MDQEWPLGWDGEANGFRKRNETVVVPGGGRRCVYQGWDREGTESPKKKGLVGQEEDGKGIWNGMGKEGKDKRYGIEIRMGRRRM